MKLFKHQASKSNSKTTAESARAAGRRARSNRDSSFEPLETRTLFSAYVVNVIGDPISLSATQISLRKAVAEANQNTGVSTITFDPSVFNTPQTMDLRSPLKVSNPAATVEIVGPAQQLTINQDLDMFTAAEVVVTAKASLVLSHLNFTNDAGVYDTGVITNAGNLGMFNCTISGVGNNNGIRAIYNTGLVELLKVTIANHGDGNSDIASGGGLYNNGGTAELADVSFNSDDAGSGGAIAQSNGTLVAQDVTINNCGADTNALGGAVSIYGGKATLTNCTIANSWMVAEGSPSGAVGVALYARASSVKLINDTITNSQLYTLGWGNTGDVPTSGSVYVGTDSKISMGNTVVSGMNELAGVVLGSGPEIVGHITSLGHNFIGQKGASTVGLVSTDHAGTNASPLNPELGNLASNGGFVQTELPKVGSPLINAGDNSLVPAGLTKDERGSARIYGGTVDIGAVETDYLIIFPIPRMVSPFRG